MVDGRQLTTDIKIALKTTYKRTDEPQNTDGLFDNLNYDQIVRHFDNGSGVNRAELQYHERKTLDSSTEVIDVNGDLTNKWGDVLAFQAVKLVAINNRATSGTLQVAFKNELYNIGPGGARIIGEPTTGIEAINSSTSSEEGALTISADDNITYDLIIIGATRESSSSGL